MTSHISDERLDLAAQKAALAAGIDSRRQSEPEDVQKASNELLEAKKLISQARQDNLRVIRQAELDSCVESYNQSIRQYASEAEKQVFDSLTKSAQRSIDRNDSEFEKILEEMKGKNIGVLLQQDWFIIDLYRNLVANPAMFFDRAKFNDLKRMGDQALARGDANLLRPVIGALLQIRVSFDSGDSMADIANTIKG